VFVFRGYLSRVKFCRILFLTSSSSTFSKIANEWIKPGQKMPYRAVANSLEAKRKLVCRKLLPKNMKLINRTFHTRLVELRFEVWVQEYFKLQSAHQAQKVDRTYIQN